MHEVIVVAERFFAAVLWFWYYMSFECVTIVFGLSDDVLLTVFIVAVFITSLMAGVRKRYVGSPIFVPYGFFGDVALLFVAEFRIAVVTAVFDSVGDGEA